MLLTEMGNKDAQVWRERKIACVNFRLTECPAGKQMVSRQRHLSPEKLFGNSQHVAARALGEAKRVASRDH